MFDEMGTKISAVEYQPTADLAKFESGVSLRAIQMYEQRKKDIRHAQVERVLALARVLGCGVEDIL